MQQSYRIFDIAEWFLHKEPMTHKKLQKLCYYAVAWGYALMDEAIVADGEFQAWVHGPVSPLLYEKYKGNLWKELSPDSETAPNFAGQLGELLAVVWDGYGKMSANSLEVLTHTESPWIAARDGCAVDARCEEPIDPEIMKQCYRKQYQQWHPEAF